MPDDATHHATAQPLDDLEPTLLSLGATSLETPKLTRYLTRLYSAAKDYTEAVRTLASETNSPREIYKGVERIYADAKELKRYGKLFHRTYRRSALRTTMDEIRDARDESWDYVPSGDLGELHYSLGRVLRQVLYYVGCPEAIRWEYIDDALHLLWEMDALVDRLDGLISGTQDPAMLVLQIAHQWEPMSMHVWYHLGILEEFFPQNYHPGVLGWSVVILSQLYWISWDR